ncbi:oxidoreductase,short chain dehydrogenase-like protein [Cadophora sp. MPI-SDFR-AT-0126]|nr:oxidoreductase,short chain dehydrogenase-like protein [Leotiomycetes sp. MPI-SDFR-AT-0126]
MPPEVWLITGSTSGFGAAFVKTLLARGDKVIATARNISKISHLKAAGASILKLDLTDDQSILNIQAKEAVAIHGKIDVLVNNAGYAHFGTVEEDSRSDWINQFQTHVFGTMAVTRAFLPQFRKQRSGTIIFMGSTAAWGGIPTLSAYCSSKAALPAAIESLQAEILPFNLRTLLIEPGFFKTELLNSTNTHFIDPHIDDYKSLTDEMYAKFRDAHGTQPNDPVKGVERIIEVVKGKRFPQRLALGEDAVRAVREKCEEILRELEEWEGVSGGLGV